MQVAVKGTDAAALCQDLPAALAATMDELGLSEPEAQPVSVALWGRRVPFTEWPSLMACPPRPAVPGMPLPPGLQGSA